jgi:hypothetical protein
MHENRGYEIKEEKKKKEVRQAKLKVKTPHTPL